jgi:hypothetical protein
MTMMMMMMILIIGKRIGNRIRKLYFNENSPMIIIFLMIMSCYYLQGTILSAGLNRNSLVRTLLIFGIQNLQPILPR